MLRRSFLELPSRRRLFRRFLKPIAFDVFVSSFSLQRPTLLHFSRNEFSTSSQQNVPPKASTNSKTPESKGSSGMVVLGSAIVAGVALLAYQSGYLDQFTAKEKHGAVKSTEIETDHKEANEFLGLGKQLATNISEEPPKFSHEEQQLAEKVEDILKEIPHVDLAHDGNDQQVQTPAELPLSVVEEKEEPKTEVAHQKAAIDTLGEEQSIGQEKSDISIPQTTDSEGGIGLKSPDLGTAEESKENIHVAQAEDVPRESELKRTPFQQPINEQGSEDSPQKHKEGTSLLNSYLLKENAEERIASSHEEQALFNAMDTLNVGSVTKDGKLVMDFLEAIHAAEKRQAELDALAFAEEKRALKEKYEKELRDLRARELMRAEEAAMLDKEIKRERSKAAAAMMTLQEKMEEKLRTEIEQKESEAEMNLKNVLELAKAELAAAIASEKAAQIEKMAEANLNINALCMAFYARSEETHQIHFVHKLALGALALEDALSKGLPIQQELDAINTYMEGIDKDSLLHLVLSTLPEETRIQGTDTLSQLNQKFNALKGTLRHYILIPPGGGGMLAHGLAQVATWLRMKEVDPSGDGIESTIGRVENFLAEGKLAEAADALQDGVQGSQAEEIVGDWVKRTRNRAIIEQALTVLQSYATSISLTQ